MQKFAGSTQPTDQSGGTSHVLPAERSNATFDVTSLREYLLGDRQNEKQWDAIFSADPLFDFTYDIHLTREEAFKLSIARTLAAHKIVKSNPKLLGTHMGYFTGKGGPGYAIGKRAQSGSSAASNHYGIYVGAIMARASDEQQKEWLQRALMLKTFGCYCQSELGHGSNVRNLLTTATFDEQTDEFVIHSPNIKALKWWPGCFSVLATHAIVYARLIIKGKDHGIHEFMVQLRDENHLPMDGIEIGDIGPKAGYQLVDNGYCRFTHVRVPRGNMLNRYQTVTRTGEYVKTKKLKDQSAESAKASSKLKYIVMIATRVRMVGGSASSLAKATTIAIRYSAVREQGFKNTRENSLASGENAVLNYKVQQYRLFKALSMSYAFFFVAKHITSILNDFQAGLAKSGDLSQLPELHATAAALKAFCTNIAGDQIEECRRCCGGHGCSLSSGIAKLHVDYISIAPIAEGDKIILALQTARFLLRSAQAAEKNQPLIGQVQYLARDLSPPNFDDLDDLDGLVHAFAFRAKRSVGYAAQDFAERLAAGDAFDEAWNACAVGLVKCAEHHAFYVMLSDFALAIEKAPNQPVRGVLRELALHFALVQIRENGADWTGVISAQQIRGVDKAIGELLDSIRPNAVSLVDAWDFSDNELQSAIGRADGNVYEALYDYAKKSPFSQPEYVQSVFADHLKDAIDRDYLREGRSKQRAGPPPSKL